MAKGNENILPIDLPSSKEEKGNFVTYVQTQLDTFDERPFCEVDSLVLSWLSYYRLPETLQKITQNDDCVAIHEWLRAEDFDAMMGSLWDPAGSRDLLFAICASPRFRNMDMTHYETVFNKETEEQFAAMTFMLPNGDLYVAFRGTDSTLVGWKEDFNLAFQCPVLSQETARRYLKKVASEFPDGRIYVGGHSKGGNLAVYAAITCDSWIQERIEAIYSHDALVNELYHPPQWKR